MARGLFVTFEGPEGAGKTTAMAAVSAALRDAGRDVLTTREPGAGPLGARIRRMLLEGDPVVPQAELFLFLADRAQHVQTILRPALRAGQVVLCDRYTDSTLAYQGYGRGMDLDTLRSLNELATGGLKPDLTLLFDLPSEVGLARLARRDRIDDEALEFHQRVREGFHREAAREARRWRLLDATLPTQAVAEKAKEILLAHPPRQKVAILIGAKGRGSNMRALIEAAESGTLQAEIAVVISPLADSPGARFAVQSGVEVLVMEPNEDFGLRLRDALEARGVRWVCLAGFTRLLPAEVLRAFPGRVLNIHPALLPKHGGKGMYGRRVHESVLAAGDAESGATVHLVTDRYDEGPIVGQATCPVLPDDTPESLAARVLTVEHRLYPAVLQGLLEADLG